MKILIVQLSEHISKLFSYIIMVSSCSQKSDLKVDSIIVHFAGLTRRGFESAGKSLSSNALTRNET
jgi:hypothetical protein